MKKLIVSSFIVLSLAVVASADAATFSKNLKLGSKGAEVTALQNLLAEKGYLSATSRGYFGKATKAALAEWQAEAGLPASGVFGPLSRAKVNTMMAAGETMTETTTTATTATFACPAGYTCAPQTTTTATTPTTNTTVSTKGVEGSIVVEKESSGIKTTVYEGDKMATVLGIRVEAKTSDATLKRINIDLGTSTDVYTRAFSKIYVTDDKGTTLAWADLNGSTVTRDSSMSPARYYITIAGMNSVIAKDTKKNFFIKLDAMSSISSEYRRSWTFGLYGNSSTAVRATDGADIDQYAGGTTVTSGAITAGTYQAVTLSSSLADSATLTLSTDPSLRKSTTIVADQGSNNNEKDGEIFGSFRALAEKDAVLVRDLKVTFSGYGATTSLQTVYLYDGSSQIASASYSGGVANFTSINYTIAKDVTKTFTIKGDIRSATASSTAYATLVDVNVTSAESSTNGKSITVSALSSGAGEQMTIVSKGAITTLASKSITADRTYNTTSGTYTNGYVSATFNVNIKAVGADAVFSTPGSGFVFALLKNDTVVATSSFASTSVASISYPSTQPTGATSYTGGSSGSFTVPRNSEVSIPVTFRYDFNNSSAVTADFTAGDYSVRLNTINYTSGGSSVTNSYTNNADWVSAKDSN